MRDQLDGILIGPAAMGAVDKAAASSGIDTTRLMQNAGEAIAAKALANFPGALRFIVFCGPGNNGGDGYVAAAALERAGGVAKVFALGEQSLKGDAKWARDLWLGEVEALGAYDPEASDVVIDAIFGAGLSRDLDADIVKLIGRINATRLPVIAVDIPSGIDGRTGKVRGIAFECLHTVTFMCGKPGHLLLPGRDYCGSVDVIDIGIPARLVLEHNEGLRINMTSSWTHLLPLPDNQSHKYSRGHLAVFSGGAFSSGAARMSAAAGLKTGAGAVTVIAPEKALGVNANHLTAVMLRENTPDTVQTICEDKRFTAFVIGPGYGIGEELYALAFKLLAHKAAVLDADALTSFAAKPESLFKALSARPGTSVMTPHEGEFQRLFPDIAGSDDLSKVEKTQKAAERSNAVVLYKGADTVIASPDGRAVINCNAPAELATAGSGDVLAGIAGSLLAQGMPAFEAACASAWIHGEAGNIAGRGLTAETLIDVLPDVLREL